MDGEWRPKWRIVLTRPHRHPYEMAFTLGSVAELRAIVERARRDREITKIRYWRIFDWDGDLPEHPIDHTRRGGAPWTAVANPIVCSCGLLHRHFRCRQCHIDLHVPPLGEGCGPVPWEQAGDANRPRP